MARIPLEERRRLLVAATLAVIQRDGIAGATARRIVQEADMPLGALHYAFDSVDHLLTAAADEVTASERLVAEEGLASAGDASLRDAIHAGLDRYIDLLEERPGHELAFLELMLHASRARLGSPAGPGRYEESYRLVAALLAQAATAAGATWQRPVGELARHTVTVLDGITTTWLADHDTAAARATARFHADALAALATTPDPS
ncbi:TetR/AcrR family transcriptional regulator [Demequina zhanjiangensis]|uniref:TetR family transcriptional regulator n=1 Tax=Demequina zhanjiangensis TaxID=3051659 RepID=A0ABT8G2B4_9MICO|nr:TetR family transcriptional regulator [Demequina sp. SYSU T00b26]MDN4473291.1 TetR family transcriptional regulator [Demequina sp. SYSU T00b26]